MKLIRPEDAKGDPRYETPLGLRYRYLLHAIAHATSAGASMREGTFVTPEGSKSGDASDRETEAYFNKHSSVTIHGEPQEIIGNPGLSKRAKSRALVLDHGWKVADAARALGVRYQMVYNYVNG